MRGALVILGFGGHARSVADVAFSCGYKRFYFIDKQAKSKEEFLGYPVQTDMPIETVEGYFLAAGDNVRRQEQWNIIKQQNFNLVTLCSPRASLSLGSFLSEGCFVGHQAHIGPMAHIGQACIINTAAIIEHEVVIGDFSHVSVNATVAGRVKIGTHVFIGAGATIKDGITIGSHITIGGGAVVVKDLLEAGTYVGVPAKKQ